MEILITPMGIFCIMLGLVSILLIWWMVYMYHNTKIDPSIGYLTSKAEKKLRDQFLRRLAEETKKQ